MEIVYFDCMSGHSKWSTIKRQKGTTDAKRGAVFTKLGNAIAIAAREGGSGDPESNFKLRLMVEKARQANMPKENIQRSIDRGLGKGGAAALENITYEGFGPAGVAVMVTVITDNSTRTVNELRMIFEKHGGTLGTPGSVAYLFTRVGEIEVENGDAIFEKAVEAGAEDVSDNVVYTKPEDLHKVSEFLGIPGSLSFRPNKGTMVTVSPGQEEKLHELLLALDDLDDVQDIFVNV